jgi:hypothetical protein
VNTMKTCSQFPIAAVPTPYYHAMNRIVLIDVFESGPHNTPWLSGLTLTCAFDIKDAAGTQKPFPNILALC